VVGRQQARWGARTEAGMREGRESMGRASWRREVEGRRVRQVQRCVHPVLSVLQVSVPILSWPHLLLVLSVYAYTVGGG